MTPEIKTYCGENGDIEFLHYRGGGPDLIMLHATGFNPWMWHPLARELAAQYNVYAPFFCGHRDADPHRGGLKWPLLADDLCALCGEHNIAAPYLVGHSMGGTVITLAVAQNKVTPLGMVLIEPIFLPEQIYRINMTLDMHPLAARSIKRTNHWKNREEAGKYLASRELFSNWDREMLELYLDYGMEPSDEGGLRLACHPRSEAALFMGSNAMDPWPLLQNIACPVLLLAGEKSDTGRYVDLKKAAALIPGGEHHVVAGAGHLIPMEKPGTVLGLIDGFFRKNAP